MIGISASAVMTIGALEASLLALDPLTFDGVHFALRCSFENLIPSCIWCTKVAANNL